VEVVVGTGCLVNGGLPLHRSVTNAKGKQVCPLDAESRAEAHDARGLQREQIAVARLELLDKLTGTRSPLRKS